MREARFSNHSHGRRPVAHTLKAPAGQRETKRMAPASAREEDLSTGGTDMTANKIHTIVTWALAGGLGLLAFGYTTRGMYYLVLGRNASDAVDLHLRWVEQRYFVRGQDPYDVWLRHDRRAASLPRTAEPTDRDDTLDPSLGCPDPTHPPWGYVSGALLLWPDWPACRIYYAAVNLVALAFLGWWAYRMGRPYGRGPAWLLTSATLAVGGTCTALEVGQYGVLVVALLAAALCLDEAGRPGWSGLLLGVSMLKPTLAGPFFLAMLLRGRLQGAALALSYWLLSGAIAWAATGAGPVEMTGQMLQVGSTLTDHGTRGVIDLFAALGLDGKWTTLATMVAVLLAACIALALWPDRSLGSAFAVAALAGRTWSYHKGYDNVLLVFLLLPLGLLAVKRKPARSAWTGFLLVGLSIWLPGRIAETEAVQVLQNVAWLAGLILLWQSQPQVARTTEAQTGISPELLPRAPGEFVGIAT